MKPATTARFASEAINTARDASPAAMARHSVSDAWAGRCIGLAILQGDCTSSIQGVRRWNDTGAMLHTTHCELILVESFLREGRSAEARTHLDAARAHCASYGEAYLAAEIDRLEGLLLQSEQTASGVVEEYL